ncbi:MAG TPA: NAD-dependent epimerase/dehydratase family protein, partial [Polyangiaceae bacterium]
MRVVVTGGAGYIGSHTAALFVELGHQVVVVDDLSGGFADAVPKGAALVTAKVSAPAMRDACERADAVVHFAGRIQVGESVTDPRKYWRENLVESLAALDAATSAKVPTFVFSSTAAVYGTPRATPIPEEHPTDPINPYGETKLAFERALA